MRAINVEHGVARPVVIFVHGYGGSRIACGNKPLQHWVLTQKFVQLQINASIVLLRKSECCEENTCQESKKKSAALNLSGIVSNKI